MTLSPRETQVLGLVAVGSTYLDIAGTLRIAHNTVKRHVSNIIEKTGAQAAVHAVAMMDDHCPGWRPLTARPVDIPATGGSWLCARETGPIRAGLR